MAYALMDSGLYELKHMAQTKENGLHFLAAGHILKSRNMHEAVIDSHWTPTPTNTGVMAAHANVDSLAVVEAVEEVNALQMDHADYAREIDANSISGLLGSHFSKRLAPKLGMTNNPLPKGYPDLLHSSGEIEQGIEIKATIARPNAMGMLAVSAHHRENTNVMLLAIDYVDDIAQIMGVFYTNELVRSDWSEPKSTRGTRNTNISTLSAAAKAKLAKGFIWAADDAHMANYTSRLLPKRTGAK